jgi:hypothetical protein
VSSQQRKIGGKSDERIERATLASEKQSENYLPTYSHHFGHFCKVQTQPRRATNLRTRPLFGINILGQRLAASMPVSTAVLPDFSCYNIPNGGSIPHNYKNYQMARLKIYQIDVNIHTK